MLRYINADEALLELDKELVSEEFNYAVRAISRVKTADVVERKKGKWRVSGMFDDFLRCSICGYSKVWNEEIFEFCPHCGAEMEETTNEV